MNTATTIEHDGRAVWFTPPQPLGEAAYLEGKRPPRYPMPALLTCFDYWPASQTETGKPALYGLDYYKPGRWREFLKIG